jgi:hypothetical protein
VIYAGIAVLTCVIVAELYFLFYKPHKGRDGS